METIQLEQLNLELEFMLWKLRANRRCINEEEDKETQPKSAIPYSNFNESSGTSSNNQLEVLNEFLFDKLNLEIDHSDIYLAELGELKQISSVSEYYDAFLTVTTRLQLPVDDYTVYLFMCGLNEQIRSFVNMFDPKSLNEAFHLAYFQESSLNLKSSDSSIEDDMEKLFQEKKILKKNEAYKVFDKMSKTVNEEVNPNLVELKNMEIILVPFLEESDVNGDNEETKSITCSNEPIVLAKMDSKNGNGGVYNLPPLVPVFRDVVPVKNEYGKKKIMRVSMERCGLATKEKVDLLTNHFKVKVSNVDGHFFHFNAALFENGEFAIDQSNVTKYMSYSVTLNTSFYSTTKPPKPPKPPDMMAYRGEFMVLLKLKMEWIFHICKLNNSNIMRMEGIKKMEKGSSSASGGDSKPPIPITIPKSYRPSSSIVRRTNATIVNPEDCEPRFLLLIRSGAWADMGYRRSMEDVYIGVDNFVRDYGGKNPCEGPAASYAVFDGHGGKHASDFACYHLQRFIFEDDCFPIEIERVIASALGQTDIVFAEACTLDADFASGTTALAAFIIGSSLVVANAGDCRAVLCRRGKAVEMSRDHKLIHIRERERIEASEGYIYDGYLNGQLNVARAIGDWHMNGLKNQDGGLLDSELEFKITKLTDEDEYLIIVCNGIWDVFMSKNAVDFMSKNAVDFMSKNAVDFAQRKLQEHNDPVLCSKDLVNEALKTKSGDNTGSDLSIFVGDLSPDVTDSVLYEIFATRYPSVRGAKVVLDANTGCSKGYGFVRFSDENERTMTMNEMNGQFCSSRPMRIGVATLKKKTFTQQQFSVQAVILAGGNGSLVECLKAHNLMMILQIQQFWWVDLT